MKADEKQAPAVCESDGTTAAAVASPPSPFSTRTSLQTSPTAPFGGPPWPPPHRVAGHPTVPSRWERGGRSSVARDESRHSPSEQDCRRPGCSRVPPVAFPAHPLAHPRRVCEAATVAAAGRLRRPRRTVFERAGGGGGPLATRRRGKPLRAAHPAATAA